MLSISVQMAPCRFHEFHGIFTLKCGFFTLISRIFTVQHRIRIMREFGISKGQGKFFTSAGRAEICSHAKLKVEAKGVSGPTFWECLPYWETAPPLLQKLEHFGPEVMTHFPGACRYLHPARYRRTAGTSALVTGISGCWELFKMDRVIFFLYV